MHLFFKKKNLLSSLVFFFSFFFLGEFWTYWIWVSLLLEGIGLMNHVEL